MQANVETPSARGSSRREGSPPVLLRWLFLSQLVRALFRVRVSGLENIPASAGAVLLANRASRLDLLLLSSACGRSVRFTPARDSVFEKWAPGAGSSSAEWREAVARGELVCVFGEPELSRLGLPLPFGKDAGTVLKEIEGPVIPVALESAALGSVWRGDGPAALITARGKWRPRVSIRFGAPLPERTSLDDACNAVQALVTDSWLERKRDMTPLHRAFVRTARRHPRRFAMADQRTPRLNFLRALARTIYLGRRLAKEWADQTHVGILLPPSIAGALVNFAALLAGKIPVNLNYTASSETVTACLKQCGITSVISSKAFLEKVPLDLSTRLVLLEDAAAAPRASERLASLLLALLAPDGLIERALGRRTPPSMDDPATVIFYSGSTGQPKGVVLSHFNIASNIAQLDRVFALTGRD
jgi:acyl-[acyl-carrier-protein]-phospholipid O-acyltransferase/long-chain-fatty-acid--[acyl-carrier-protein] ligase